MNSLPSLKKMPAFLILAVVFVLQSFSQPRNTEKLFRIPGELESEQTENKNIEKARKDRRDKLTEDMTGLYNQQRESFEEPIRLIDDMLQTKNEAELESPAAILKTVYLQPLPGISTPDTEILIKANPDYYKKDLTGDGNKKLKA